LILTEAEEKQRERGVSPWLVGRNPGVLQMVRRLPLGASLGREAMHFNVEMAVMKYLEMLTASKIRDNGAPNSRQDILALVAAAIMPLRYASG
jgi:hypothetical protein